MAKLRFGTVAVALTLTFAGAASAEPEAPRAMTLDEALAFARRESPAIKGDAARVSSAEARAREPDAAWKTRLGATLQATGSSNNGSATNWLGSKGAVELPRISGTGYLKEPSAIDWKPYASTAAGVTAEQRLFDFGRVAAESAATDALVDVARARLDDRRLGVDLAVRETYHAVLSARAVLEVARDAAARARLHRDEARARVAQGMRSRIEQERAEADLARYEVNVIRAEGGVRASQAAFAAAVGVPSTLLDASEPASPTPNATVPPIEDALAKSSRADPAVRAALANARATRLRTQALAALTRPELWAVGTVVGAAGGAPRERTSDATWGAGAVPWIPNYYAGVVFAWRFVDPVVSARTESARRDEDAAAADAVAIQQSRVALVEQAWAGLDVAVRSLPGLDRAVAAARANHLQAETRFQSGLGTSVELADAEALRVAAEIELVQGRFEVERARARLARATGGAQ